jgi:type IV fimbrial biogenesis protein FimT
MHAMANRGFTLVELLIAVAVAGVMLALGVPAMTTWLGNVAIRTNAEAINDAIQLARSEAIRRNASVQIVFDAAGRSWTTTQVSDSSMIQQRTAEGRAETVNVTFAPDVRTITFGALGTITDADASRITALKVDSNTLAAANSREMCITLTVSGGSRMCDPARATGSLEAGGSGVVTKDPQSCQPSVPAVCTVTP